MISVTAADIGFNYVKGLVSNSDRRAFFPSVVGEPFAETFSMSGARTARLTVTLDGQVYPTGDTAMRQSKHAGGALNADWVLGQTWKVLFCAALSELHKASVETCVVVGLPLEDYGTLEARLTARLVGQRFTLKRNDGRQQTVTVKDAVCLTQPYGSLLDQAMDNGGHILSNPFATGLVGVCDLGGNTLNLLVCDALEERSQWTRGDGLGLLETLDDVARAIHQKYPTIEPKAREVSAWLAAGEFSYRGTKHDIMPIVKPFLDPLLDRILDRLAEVWREPGRFDAVLLTGGASVVLGRELKTRMDGVYPNVTVAQDAQWSNARGYLKFGLDFWRT